MVTQAQNAFFDAAIYINDFSPNIESCGEVTSMADQSRSGHDSNFKHQSYLVTPSIPYKLVILRLYEITNVMTCQLVCILSWGFALYVGAHSVVSI
jgi:hypothetical protein